MEIEKKRKTPLRLNNAIVKITATLTPEQAGSMDPVSVREFGLIDSEGNFLVLGEQDYSKIKKLGKSNKHIKAEKLKAQGQEIEIIPETVFYDFLEECTSEMEES